MTNKNIMKQIPTKYLLSDLSAKRRGVLFAGNNKKYDAEIKRELARRKKLGLVRKDAGKAKRRTGGYGMPNFRMPRF